MIRIFWQLVYFLFVVAVFAVPIVASRTVLRKLRAGRTTRLKGFVTYAVVALSPTVVYVWLFLSMVGIEQMFNVPLIEEGIGRTFLFVVAFGLLVWLVSFIPFAAVAARAKVPPDPLSTIGSSSSERRG